MSESSDPPLDFDLMIREVLTKTGDTRTGACNGLPIHQPWNKKRGSHIDIQDIR